MFGHVNETLGAPPVPASEWPALERVLGVDLLARLLSVSTVSLRRYVSGVTRTPHDVTVRSRALALMVGDLAGAYSDAGIRRWFARPRRALGNRAPVDVLTAGWHPDDPEPRQVRGLANAMTGPPGRERSRASVE